MTSQDVLDQIRDLQSFIDDFAVDAGTNRDSIMLPSPLELQKPDEITEDNQKEKTIEVKKDQEISLEKYKLNLSSDFSLLVEQFKEQPSPIIKYKPEEKDAGYFQHRNSTISNNRQEKIQVEITEDLYHSRSALSSPFIHSDSAFANRNSRQASISSGKSQKSVKSARKTSGKKNHQQKAKQSVKYIERSYDEMMRIPNIYERLAFYEKTLDLCLQAESPISNWVKHISEKGLPQPMTEGYIPPWGSTSMESICSESFSIINSPFSGSISTFLKRSGSQGIPRGNSSENRFMMTPTSHTVGSLFGRSFSRLSLSRSAQIPRYDQVENQRFAKTPRESRSSRIASSALTPLRTDYEKPIFSFTPKSTASTPRSFGLRKVYPPVQPTNDSASKALNYMMTVLPQIDTDILSNALDEAKGDPMVAITIAVSQSKRSFMNDTISKNNRISFAH